MDNINTQNNRPVSYTFTQGIGDYSAEQVNHMDIADLMTLILTRMQNAKELQFKQKLDEADARTKKLEVFGEQMKALARIKTGFGSNDKDDTPMREAQGVKSLVSADQWDESAVDHELTTKSKPDAAAVEKKTSSKYGAYENLSGGAKLTVWENVNDYLDANLTDAELKYLKSDGGEGNPVLDASIREKYVKVWHDAGYEPPKTLSEKERMSVFVSVDSSFTYKAERLNNASKAYYSYQDKQAESKDEATDAASSDTSADVLEASTWRSELSADGQQYMGSVDTFCQTGVANGTLTDADADNIMSGNFTKSDLESLEVAIKNEQDKIGSMNTRDQIDIQKITNQIDQLVSLLSTLTKKFFEGASSVINKM